jgi:cyclic pyranopterin phosphate synthase
MPVHGLKLLGHGDILSYEEILRVIGIATDLGVDKVRLTGGEPLVRKGFVQLVDSVCQLVRLQDVSVTTNGVLLEKMALPLFEAGLRRINVSLDTLNPLKYEKITGRPSFQAVWKGLQTAEAIGFSPIKVNVVAMRGLNDDELRDFARLSMEKPYHIRFIEYMPIGRDSNWTSEKYISSDEIKGRLESMAQLRKVSRAAHDGPAERYQFESASGEIGFISALSHHFCPSCNRLRLTADGKLRPCLFAEDEVDIKSPLRSGAGEEDLKRLFHEAIDRKPKRHHFQGSERKAPLRPMSTIGG